MPTGFGPGLAKSSQLSGAVTTITSLLATDIVIGEDPQTKIDFETANEIHFDADNKLVVFIEEKGGAMLDMDIGLYHEVTQIGEGEPTKYSLCLLYE